MRRVNLSDFKLGSNGVGRMINRDIVLKLIRTKQQVSRADLALCLAKIPSGRDEGSVFEVCGSWATIFA